MVLIAVVQASYWVIHRNHGIDGFCMHCTTLRYRCNSITNDKNGGEDVSKFEVIIKIPLGDRRSKSGKWFWQWGSIDGSMEHKTICIVITSMCFVWVKEHSWSNSTLGRVIANKALQYMWWESKHTECVSCLPWKAEVWASIFTAISACAGWNQAPLQHYLRFAICTYPHEGA